jgi:hypothetical protein
VRALALLLFLPIVGCSSSSAPAVSQEDAATADAGGGGGGEVPDAGDPIGEASPPSCPSIALDDDFERDSVEGPHWKHVAGNATLGLDTSEGAGEGNSLRVTLLKATTTRAGFLERSVTKDACKVSLGFKLRLAALPATGTAILIASVALEGSSFVGVRIDGSDVGLVEKDADGESFVAAGTLAADAITGIAFVLDRRTTPPKIGLSLTEAAPHLEPATRATAPPVAVRIGAVLAAKGAALTYAIDDVRLR